MLRASTPSPTSEGKEVEAGEHEPKSPKNRAKERMILKDLLYIGRH